MTLSGEMDAREQTTQQARIGAGTTCTFDSHSRRIVSCSYCRGRQLSRNMLSIL
jgi:hypothetical protein